MSEQPAFDVIIKGGRCFDGSSRPSALRNIGVRNGRVVAVSTKTLDESGCPEVIDAGGQWVMPGFIDSVTHSGADVLADPALTDSVRQGVTSVVLSSHEIGTVCRDMPIGAGWRSPAGYVAHLCALPLGPNIASFMGHADLRASVMGKARACDAGERPTDAELYEMENLLCEALDVGMLGLSALAPPDGQREVEQASGSARWPEHRKLGTLLRLRGRIHQGALQPSFGLSLIRWLFASAGVLRAPLKTTLIASSTGGGRQLTERLLIKLFNKLADANLRWQAPASAFSMQACSPQLASAIKRVTQPFQHAGRPAETGSKIAPTHRALQLLHLVHDAERKGRSFMSAEQALWQLSGEPAKWLGLDAGRLRLGDRADIVIVDPDGLASSATAMNQPQPDTSNVRRLHPRQGPGHAVSATLINGRVAYRNGRFMPDFGVSPGYGRFLRAGQPPARASQTARPKRAARAA